MTSAGKGASFRGRADFPVCRFGRLSSRPEHRAGKPGEPADWKVCPTARSDAPYHSSKKKTIPA